MSKENTASEKPKSRRFPYVTAATTALIALVGWKGDSELVRSVTDVYPDSTWLDWGMRWPGSFFKAGPYLGEPTDTALSAASTALTLGLTERREGAGKTLKVAAMSQLVGCLATRAAAVSGMVPSENMHELDVGSSAVTVALGARYGVHQARQAWERGSTRDMLIWGTVLGTAAVGLTVSAFTDPDKTAPVGHLSGLAYGMVSGWRSAADTPPPDFLPLPSAG